MLDNHYYVNDILFFQFSEASRGVVEHDLVAGYIQSSEIIPQRSGEFVDFSLCHPPDLEWNLTFKK